jgi:hypothetical protein
MLVPHNDRISLLTEVKQPRVGHSGERITNTTTDNINFEWEGHKHNNRITNTTTEGHLLLYYAGYRYLAGIR